jgi:hypothetical protein
VRRSEALASLSRDHHQTLVVAQKLRRAGSETASAAREAFLEHWSAHGRRHFRAEEEVLFPAYAGYGDAHHPLLLRALGEHVEIRHRAEALSTDPSPACEALNDLGGRLSDHVRLEERELVPLIEGAMPESELTALVKALEEAEAAT